MRRIVIFLAIYLSVYNLTINAQNRAIQRETELFFERLDLTGDYNLLRTLDPITYKGTPYYNDSFLLGNIFYDNELLKKNVALRYNVFFDEIEYKKALNLADENYKILIKTENLYTTINQEVFVFRNGFGYFLVLFDGTNISLLKKISKKYFPPKKAATSLTKDYPAEFKDRFEYYLITKDKEIQLLPNSKNKRLKVFSKNKALKDYIEKNKINLSNQSDLEKLIRYYDSLD